MNRAGICALSRGTRTGRTGWMAPPHFPPHVFLARPTRAITRSIARAARHGRFRGVVLTLNATDTRWWQLMAKQATAACLVSGRPLIRAAGPSDLLGGRYTRQGQTCGTIALAFGDIAAFESAWAPFGSIIVRWRRA